MATELKRDLGLTDSISLVVGGIVGTGIFLKTSTMSQAVGSPTWVLLAWVVAGALSLMGALAYAELGAIFPKAGGEYVYLKEGHGELFAFMYGWMRFWIGSPGSIAAYAVGAATFLSAALNFGTAYLPYVAVFLILWFSLVNCLSVAFGGTLNSIMTAVKFTIILGLVIGIFIFSKTGSWAHLSTPASLTPTKTPEFFSAFGSAVLAALWAFDGWNNLAMVAGEMKDPNRNIPKSFGIGLALVLLIYGLSNLSYFYALPFSEILQANSTAHPDALPVATLAAVTFLGNQGTQILSIAFVFSAIGAMNGSIMTNARVPFAMAQDGLFLKGLAKLHPKTHVPMNAVLIQAGVASALALSGTFDQLTDYVVFSSWIFYAMVTSVVFKLRRQKPNLPRPYRVLGYPVLPGIFIAMGLLLLVNTIYTSPKSTLIGLVFIMAGLPVYFFFRRKA
ncbi:MAG: amino acid permease [Bdellovibrionales bacterium]|nr:amino acid permease [Bdellovibrionales bacterium]